MPFIERDFPVGTIDRIARSESSSRKPIYSLHKWFARRVGSTFRAILLGTFLDDDPMDHFYEPTRLRNGEGEPPVVLDPFMGGGTTLVEAHKMGCRVVGVDVNPVAWFITKRELEAVPRGQIEAAFDELAGKVEGRLRRHYETTCPRGHSADAVYLFWISAIPCGRCGGSVPLFRSYQLVNARGKAPVYYCPSCEQVFECDPLTSPRDHPTCPGCGRDLGKPTCTDKRYTCQHCGFEGDITKAWLSAGRPPVRKMFAVEYYCETCEDGERGTGARPGGGRSRAEGSALTRGRGIKVPGPEDLAEFEAARDEFLERRGELLGKLVPDQEIHWGSMETTRPRNTVFRYWHQFFNERQLLCLSTLLGAIREVEPPRVREVLLLAFSNTLNANNMYCIYNPQRVELEPLFKHHYFSPPKMPVENNVWGAKIGRGSFVKSYRRVLAAIQYQEAPFEVRLRDPTSNNNARGRRRVPLGGVNIAASLKREFGELVGARDALLRCQSSVDLSFIPDESVDAVVSDPPYYDNIMYSEVSEFFRVWLQLALAGDYPREFGPGKPERANEILVNTRTGKGAEFYTGALTRVFSEARRVLKPSGLLVFAFQHKRPEGWETLLRALANAEFRLHAAYPTHGESRTGLRQLGLVSNAILVCGKDTRDPGGKQNTGITEGEQGTSRQILDPVEELTSRIEAFFSRHPESRR
ncbi:MAG: DUF1156 domain-containing protein [Promethearchaeota archaeon]